MKTERLPVKHGAGIVNDGQLMTRAQAEMHAHRAMDPALRRVGFVVVVTRSDPEMHGGNWFRINYGYDRRV